MKKLLLLTLLFPFLMACSNHIDEDEYENQEISLATVENPNLSTNYLFTLDDNTRMKSLYSELKYYRPQDGQRIIATYSILTDIRDSTYDHDVKVNDIYEVLTKNIFNISESTQDSIGNDYIQIKGLWVSNDYLNVEFAYPGYNKTHFINLVSDTSKTYTDNKVHLEFRHNANNDYPSYNQWGIVSFNLKSLQANATDSVQLVIHSKEYYYGEGTYSTTYQFGSNVSPIKKHTLSLQAQRAKIN